MTFSIRYADEADIPALQALARATLPATPENERLLKRIYSETSLRRSINSESSTLLVAEKDDLLIGMCHFGSPLLDECEDRKEIHRLLIHPDHTNQGIASELLYCIEDDLDEDTVVQRLSVYIDPADKPRLRFFGKHGFHHDQLEDKDDLWYMEKDL
jgi:N-acetylglutamate synthase-like GNAT family acetyltransferase